MLCDIRILVDTIFSIRYHKNIDIIDKYRYLVFTYNVRGFGRFQGSKEGSKRVRGTSRGLRRALEGSEGPLGPPRASRGLRLYGSMRGFQRKDIISLRDLQRARKSKGGP